jgi:hypothetical protein
MNVSNKFNSKSKQKMRKMINLSYKNDCEYFTVIKKDFSLGEITKGEKDACCPNNLTELNKGNVIGHFHTHPYTKETYYETLNKGLDFFNELKEKGEDIDTINRMKKIFPKNIINTFSKMSINDIRYAISSGFTVECIGFRDDEEKSRVFCHILYPDAKKRLINNCKSLDKKMQEIFKKTFLNWINGRRTNDLEDSFILMIITEWIIEETCEVHI